MVFERLSSYWSENGFTILVIGSVALLLLMALFRFNKKGTYETDIDVPPELIMKKGYKPPQPSYEYSGGYSGGKDSRLEVATRQALKEIFNRPFNKCRPDFLRNPVTKNFNMEIDCFDEELRLGIEVQGRQHYEFVPYFHKTKADFQNQQYRDELKRRMCKDNRIVLIEVPYTVKEKDVKFFLLSELKKVNIPV